jgi:tetratricopeptide (TPR) repeat protein
MVHERVGAPQRVKDYIDMAMIAQNPEECLSAYMRKYTAGDISPQFIQNLLTRLSDAYIPISAVMKKYFATQKESELLYRPNWNIIYRFVGEINDPAFDYFFKHRSEYAENYSKDSVNNKISEVFMYTMRGALQNPNSKLADSAYLALKEKVKASGFEDADKVLFATELQRLQMRGKNQEFLDLAFDGVDKYYEDDYNMLSNIAQIVSSMSSEQKFQEKALSWLKRSVSIREEPANTDAYASLLFKMGNKDEAIKQEKKAIDLAKKNYTSSASYEAAMKRMEGSR